jgi:pimeloyl-ACP methyl ester carboxylesterase
MTATAQPRIPTPHEAARLFLTPNRNKARVLLERPSDAQRLSIPFGETETIAAWEWGAGPTILLVHGWEGSHADLDGFVAPLIAAGLRAIAMDLPAHGASTGTLAPIPLLAKAI